MTITLEDIVRLRELNTKRSGDHNWMAEKEFYRELLTAAPALIDLADECLRRREADRVAEVLRADMVARGDPRGRR